MERIKTQNMKNLLLLLLISIFSQGAISQTKETKLVEFSNTNSEFTVPEGKTWHIHNIFSSAKTNDGDWNFVRLERINGVTFGDNGTIFTGSTRNWVQYPLVFPQNTTFKLKLADPSSVGIMTYTEE
jgi:hypothetical protein